MACEEIASEIPSATSELVVRVLKEYGDPAAEDSGEDKDDHDSADEPSGDDSSANSATEHEVPRFDALSDKERETFRAIHKHPEESQREIASRLGVSGPTVNCRVNSVKGFDWDTRQTFTAALFENESADSEFRNTASSERQQILADGPQGANASPRDDSDQNEDDHVETGTTLPADKATEAATAATSEPAETDSERVLNRLDSINRQLDTLASKSTSDTAFEEPELVHKVLHACFRDENITEEEELHILEEFLH